MTAHMLRKGVKQACECITRHDVQRITLVIVITHCCALQGHHKAKLALVEDMDVGVVVL